MKTKGISSRNHSADIKNFQRRILDWYSKHGRTLPWRATQDPYHILVSEIMLQQTQVSRVLPKYTQFLRAFPNASSLASSDDRDLLTIWSGLGYWRRAQYVKQTAHIISTQYDGLFPREPHELQKLPGIGPYTAGAVACFAFNCNEPFIDTNIRRVYLHSFFPERDNVSDHEIMDVARKAVWKKDPKIWHWALFDYSALELKQHSINRKSRHYVKQSKFEGSFRFFRTHVMHHLLSLPDSTAHQDDLLDFIDETLQTHERDYSAKNILESLVKDGLVKKEGLRYSI